MLAAGAATEQGAPSLPTGPARAGSTTSRVLRAVSNAVAPVSAEATVAAAVTDPVAGTRNTASSTTPAAEETDPRSYYTNAALAAAVGFGVGSVLAAFGFTLATVPNPMATGILMAVGLIGGALGAEGFFIVRPPATYAEWSAQRFWITTVFGLFVAAAASMILFTTLPLSLPAAVIEGVAIGFLAALINYYRWQDLSPPPGVLLVDHRATDNPL